MTVKSRRPWFAVTAMFDLVIPCYICSSNLACYSASINSVSIISLDDLSKSQAIQNRDCCAGYLVLELWSITWSSPLPAPGIAIASDAIHCRCVTCHWPQVTPIQRVLKLLEPNCRYWISHRPASPLTHTNSCQDGRCPPGIDSSVQWFSVIDVQGDLFAGPTPHEDDVLWRWIPQKHHGRFVSKGFPFMTYNASIAPTFYKSTIYMVLLCWLVEENARKMNPQKNHMKWSNWMTYNSDVCVVCRYIFANELHLNKCEWEMGIQFSCRASCFIFLLR